MREQSHRQGRRCAHHDAAPWLRMSRRPRRSRKCSTVSEIVDAHVPQFEEEQTADVATHSSKREALVQ